MPNTRTVSLHTATPTLSAWDGRGLVVRSVAYHRANTSQQAETRVTRRAFDPSGRAASHWDPRLWVNGKGPNLSTGYSLSGNALRSESVDSGWRVRLMGVAAQLLSEWDGRNSQLHIDYDSLMRPIAITEQADGASSNVTERLTYADSNSESAAHNQCGALERHDDTAGCRHIADYGLSGSVLSESRQFLIELSTPNWPKALDDRDELLETEIATTHWQFDATGAVVSQLDARRNETLTRYNVCGQLAQIELKREGLPDKVLLDRRIYSATSQIEQEESGNGVRTIRRYDTENGRLLQLTSRLGPRCYQDCHYDYDPVGNVVRISDNAQPVRHFKNRRTTPIDSYRYDTLYQLYEATGRESIPTNQGPGLPELHTPQLDPTRMGPYKQTFTYDQAGNLRSLVHEGSQSYTRTMITAPSSNRSLLKPKIGEPDFEAEFDANGNLQSLSPSTQKTRWNTRNQLSETTQITRPNATDDCEYYRYDAAGIRVRKFRNYATKRSVHTYEIRYLSGLEIHCINGAQEHHVIMVAGIESNSIRAMHWTDPPPKGIENNHIRYNLVNHLGSSIIEVNDEAVLLSQEGFYPFGETAWWAARSDTEARMKSNRYAMKERDINGLYYYGHRYYAPWLLRWISPDPQGIADGLNVFLMVHNKPTNLKDLNGLAAFDVLNEYETSLEQQGQTILYRSPDELPSTEKSQFLEDMSIVIRLNQLAKAELDTEATSEETMRKLESLFGVDITSNERTLRQAKSALSTAISVTLEGQLQDQRNSFSKFVFTSNNPKRPNVFAHVPKLVPQETKSIYLHEKYNEGSQIHRVQTINHETTHLYHGTEDFWYLGNKSYRGATPSEIESSLNRVLTSSAEIVKNSPSESEMQPQHLEAYIQLIDKIGGPERRAPWPHIHRMSSFTRNTDVRIAVVAANADSVAGFAALFYKYR